ncbi:MAG: ABC transporter permease [Bacteroidota bacterium]
MELSFIHSFQSEWLKKKRSAAAWLTIIGGFFIPAIILVNRFIDSSLLREQNTSNHLWEAIYNRCWQFMALFLLPMGVILASSLITQLEFKNNTWKQLHTTPQRLTIIFFAKLTVILVMMLQFFILFNIGIYLTGIIPAVFFRNVPYPLEAFPFVSLLKANSMFFLDSLPIIAIQYFISLQFKNFLVPVGTGLAMYTASMIGLSWKYGYILPYSYSALNLNFMKNKGAVNPSANIHLWSIGYFIVFSMLSYIFYINKKEKG